MSDLSLFNLSQTVSVMLDGFAIIILGIIIISALTFKNPKMKRKQRIIMYCALFGILAAGLDALCMLKTGQMASLNNLLLYSRISSVALATFLLVKATFTLTYIDDTKGSNKIFKILAAVFSFILIITSLIPAIYSLVYRIDDDATIQTGPLMFAYNIALSLIELTTFSALVFNTRKLPYGNVLVLAIFQLLPLVSYFLSGQKASPAFFFMSISLLFSYIILFQSSALDSYKKEAKLAVIDAENKDMKTKLMVSQIQPHFLYNTLSSIAYYCTKEPETAKRLTLSFSDYLRNNIDSLDGEKIITFNQELDHIKTYLEIEKIRFGERINVIYEINFDHFMLPSLVIQPIVENAIKHGLCKKEDGGTLIIRTEKKEGEILITIADDGVGFDTSIKKDDGKSHIGLSNVSERLKVFCGGTIDVVSFPGEGTTVEIRIPLEAEK